MGKERRDTVRDAFLGNRSLGVFRFDDHQLLKNAEAVLKKIFKAITGG